MFNPGEVINLVSGVIALFFLPILIRDIKSFDFRMFKTGYYMLLLAYLFTVIEGVLWNEVFNLLEHTCYALFGFFFCRACMNLKKNQRIPGGQKK